MLKIFCILALMFISVLAGMQIANNGLHQMKGDHPPDMHTSSVVETGSTSHDILAKQQKLEKMNAFNLFSSMGKKLSTGISNSSEKIIKSIAK